MEALSEDRKAAQRVARVSLITALVLIAVKLTAGIASGSLALISEAVHSTFDAGVTLVTLLAVRIAARPPDEDHPYGHGRAENLAALIESIALIALAGVLAREAVQRLAGGAPGVEATWYAYAVIGGSMVVEAWRAAALRNAGRRYRSPALEADGLHFFADLLSSIVVLIGLVAVTLGFPAADAWAALAIAVYVAVQSVLLGKRSADVLMDRAPSEAVGKIAEAVGDVEGVAEVRRVRVRSVGGRSQTDVVVAVSRTVPLEKAHEVSEEIETVVGKLEPGADVVVHVEPLADETEVSQMVMAVAARHAEVRQVHNVSVTFGEAGLQITLHAKFPGEMTLDEAHRLAEELEREIAAEIGGVDRVDTHLEPLESPAATGDVTAFNRTLVAWVKAFAEQQPEVLNCHEVLVNARPSGGLEVLMHCEASPGASVVSVHKAATRIEDGVHRRFSDVEKVTVHFEPEGAGDGPGVLS